MIDYKRVLLALMRGANRRRKLALDEGEIIGWATHEDGQHYPIHAAQGGGGSSSASSGGGSSGGRKSSQSSGGSGKMSSGGGGMNKDYRVKSNEITQGSEKQISWAKSIQNDFVETVNSNIKQINEREAANGFYPDADEQRTAWKLLGETFQEKSKGKPASWYIDNRNGSLNPRRAIGSVNERVRQMKQREQETGKTLKELWNERKST